MEREDIGFEFTYIIDKLEGKTAIVEFVRVWRPMPTKKQSIIKALERDRIVIRTYRIHFLCD